MDFLNRGFAQLSDLFKSMSPGARITAALLLGVIVVSLGYLFHYQAAGPDTYLMGGEPFSASQLPAMEAAFGKAGLSTYTVEGNRIRVPKGQQHSYMAALADEGALPATFGKYMEKALASGPFTTRLQQEELLKVAKQHELTRIIQSMKGIESASVLYDVQQKRGFGEENVVTASVTIKPVGMQALDEERIPMLRHLVAGAIAGLKPEQVIITDANGTVYSGGSGSGGSAGEDEYAKRKKAYEKDWVNKVRDTLRFIPNVVVNANVELDQETEHEENIVDYTPKPVAVKVNETTDTKTTESVAPGGRPGLGAQGGVNQPAVLTQAAGPKQSHELSKNDTINVVPTTSKKITLHGMMPKRVTISVAIPSNYFEKVWTEQNPTPAGQTAKKADPTALVDIEKKIRTEVENAVVALLPLEGPTVNKYPRVTVTSFQPITPPPIAQPGLPDKAIAWLGQYWTTLGMTGLALFSLLMLRSTVRLAPSTPSAEPLSMTIPMTPSMDEPQQESEPQTARSRLKRPAGAGGPSLRDELSELVREDPDSAVSILRNWIGNAS